MLRNIDIDLIYQPLIDGPPASQGNIFARACEGDQITIKTWHDIWLKQYAQTKEKFGSFHDHSVGKLYGSVTPYVPSIIAGSGPSLKHSIDALKQNQSMRNPLTVISCLHNFGYFMDEGIKADYWMTLDAGDIVIRDINEGRKEQEYWDKTKGQKLLAYTCSHPELFKDWQGDVNLFNCFIPEEGFRKELDKIENFKHYLGTGGNALGACLYFTKVVLRSDVVHFVGADFCFDYNNTFHSYKTHYDNMGNYIVWPDCYGNLRKTWGSYLNFKFYLDHIACSVPGRYVNCSEGLLGAYREGNIRQFQYMSLKDALVPYRMTEKSFLEERDIKGNTLNRIEFDLKEVFTNPKYDKDIIMF